MAKVTRIIYVDDLTGEESETPLKAHPFQWGGHWYVVETAKSAVELEQMPLGEIVAKAQRVAGQAARQAAAKPAAARSAAFRERLDARNWLVANGYEVPLRGRIPQQLMDAYDSKAPAANGNGKPADTSAVPAAASNGNGSAPDVAAALPAAVPVQFSSGPRKSASARKGGKRAAKAGEAASADVPA